MKPVGTIPLRGWLTANSTREVMEALMANNGVARFVGGCVRDSIIDRPIADIDIATTEPPEQVIELLTAVGIKTVPVGISHGAILAVTKDISFHITTLRTDIETYGRRAKVSFVDNWEEDAKRRDFTMNAMYADLDGTLYDPCGGVADLKDRRIKFIGNPDKRIAEDYLRILRFFRFQAYYGSHQPDAPALEACSKAAPHLRELSAERIWAEFRRLLTAPTSAKIIACMQKHDILPHLFSDLRADTDALTGLIALEDALDIESTTMRRLSALVQKQQTALPQVIRRMRFSKNEEKHLTTLTQLLHQPPKLETQQDSCRVLYRYGALIYKDLILLLTHPNHEWLLERLNYAEAWRNPRLPVQGSNLMKLGLDSGPSLGKFLKEIETWWLDNCCEPNRQQCLEWFKTRNKS